MRVIQDYQGKPVRLTDERLNHIKEHPEMVNMDRALDETLTTPQLVMQSVYRRYGESELSILLRHKRW